MHPLDNVIWQALTTRQAQFAQSSGLARRFIPEIGPLAGFSAPSHAAYESLAEILAPQGTLALFLDKPYEDRTGWTAVGGAPLLQMIWEKQDSLPSQSPLNRMADSEPRIAELSAENSSEMIELTGLTKPGPFHPRTHELGSFVGIHREGKLVAMAGERMKVPGFSEVSAVCTHPAHAGHGYASILMTEVMRRIVARGETPFLHVREDNTRAIEVYKRLGFVTRMRAFFVILRKD